MSSQFANFGGVPPNAVHVGHDIDGAGIYVGRAYHEGNCIPAKVIPTRNIAYVPYGGAEVAKHDYEVRVSKLLHFFSEFTTINLNSKDSVRNWIRMGCDFKRTCSTRSS